MFEVSQPDRTVGLFVSKSWAVEVLCHACRKRTVWGIAALRRRFDPRITLGQIAERLKCECGSTDGQINERQDIGAARYRDVARFEASGKYKNLES